MADVWCGSTSFQLQWLACTVAQAVIRSSPWPISRSFIAMAFGAWRRHSPVYVGLVVRPIQRSPLPAPKPQHKETSVLGRGCAEAATDARLNATARRHRLLASRA